MQHCGLSHTLRCKRGGREPRPPRPPRCKAEEVRGSRGTGAPAHLAQVPLRTHLPESRPLVVPAGMTGACPQEASGDRVCCIHLPHRPTARSGVPARTPPGSPGGRPALARLRTALGVLLHSWGSCPAPVNQVSGVGSLSRVERLVLWSSCRGYTRPGRRLCHSEPPLPPSRPTRAGAELDSPATGQKLAGARESPSVTPVTPSSLNWAVGS